MNRRLASVLAILPLTFLTTCTTPPPLNYDEILMANSRFIVRRDKEQAVVRFSAKDKEYEETEYRLPIFTFDVAMQEMSSLDCVLASETSFLERILNLVDSNHDYDINYAEMITANLFKNTEMLEIKNKSKRDYLEDNPSVTLESLNQLDRKYYLPRTH